MRRATAYCWMASFFALAACAAPKAPDLPPAIPLNVDDGQGSEHGNYAAAPAGETRGPDGARCFLFDWDRPLTKDFAVRVRSESCESPAHPGWMSAREISRRLVPMAQSHLNDAQP